MMILRFYRGVTLVAMLGELTWASKTISICVKPRTWIATMGWTLIEVHER